MTDEGQTSGQAGGQVSGHVGGHVGRISKGSKVHNDTLNDTLEYKIINLVRQNPSITQRDIFGNLKVSLVSVKRTMKKLIDSQE